MAWRRLRAGELDHEALWLGVSVATAAAAWTWTAQGWPTPQCAFHAVTGVPCPGCGATRAFVQLTRGAWETALALNPLACAAFGAVALFDGYAALVLLARAPRWRPRCREWGHWRLAVLASVLLNWAWRLRAGV